MEVEWLNFKMSIKLDVASKYLIIQPSIELFTLGRNPVAVPVNPELGTPTFTAYVQIPIPLISNLDFVNNIASITGLIETAKSKNSNIMTSQVANLVNSLSTAGDFNGEITFANDNFFYQERGETTFNLVLMSDVNNVFDTVLTGYLELASKTLFNTRFHYISQNMIIFNMILRSVSEDASENNKTYTLSFYKPQQDSTQDFSDNKTGETVATPA